MPKLGYLQHLDLARVLAKFRLKVRVAYGARFAVAERRRVGFAAGYSLDSVITSIYIALTAASFEQGPIDVVMIGAFGVGRMSLACCDLLTNTGGKATQTQLSDPLPCERGEHLGTFHLGSTVVLVTPKGHWNWSVKVGESVKMGQLIGHL